jgi:hypothetical protein
VAAVVEAPGEPVPTEPRLSMPLAAAAPVGAAGPAVATDPFAQAAPVAPPAAPVAPPAAPVARPAAPFAPVAAEGLVPVAAPPGSLPATAASEERLHRPITAVTGAASIQASHPEPVTPPADQAPDARRVPDASPARDEPPMPPAAGEAPANLAHVPTGPRLHLRVESATSMVATLDGASEAITLDELRAAAGALARADGSATIETAATAFEARSLAQEAFESLSDAGVPSELHD